MKQQVIVIHGADSFKSYERYLDALKNWEVALESFLPKNEWKMHLQEELGNDFQVLSPRMPNKQNARYAEWKIWFEKILPFVADGVILIGHSQGGLFLAKYLSENVFPKKIKALLLVAPPFSNTEHIGDFVLGESLENISQQCEIIHLYQSEDDPVVPYDEVERYKKALPMAEMHIFKDRGHFLQEDFPELLEEIKK